MTNTTYYNLNIVEGTDIVNPLTVDNPNYEKIDETMHNNAVSGVTLATEIANATVHAITRENSECAVIRFIATSEWKAGDTVTVDGVPVTALLPSGETLPDGAYVINANVLCILTGTYMTVFAERKKTDTAKDIKYNETNVGSELDKINRNLSYKTLDVDLSTEFQDTFNVLDGSQNSFILGKLVVLDMMYNYNHKREDQFWDGKFSINVRLKHKITGIITSWNGVGYATMEIYPSNDGSNKSICNVEGLGRLSTGYCQFHAIGVME